MFSLQYKPTIKGIFRRFQRNYPNTSKCIKFSMTFVILTSTFLLVLPSLGLPFQDIFKKWQYRTMNDISYYWFMVGSRPDKQTYILRKLQLALSSINNHSQDWQFVFQTLQQTLFINQKQQQQLKKLNNYNIDRLCLKKDQLSAITRIHILTYSSIFLLKIIELKSSFLKKDQTYYLFKNIIQEHFSYIMKNKQYFKKAQISQIIKIYSIFQYLLKYSHSCQQSISILKIYKDTIKQQKVKIFSQYIFVQKQFIKAMKSIYISNAKKKQQKQLNAQIFQIFGILDKIKAQKQSNQNSKNKEIDKK